MLKTLELKIRVHPKKLSVVAVRALTHLEQYDWILFTSKNAVRFFVKTLRTHRIRFPKSVRVAAVGPETARAARAAKIPVHVIPKKYTVLDMVKSLGTIRNTRILFPRSAIAPPEAIEKLRKGGGRVTVIPLYTTTAEPISEATKRRLLADGYQQLIFKSPSGVNGFMQQLKESEKKVVRKIPIACMGPSTLRAARAAGFRSVSIKAVL